MTVPTRPTAYVVSFSAAGANGRGRLAHQSVVIANSRWHARVLALSSFRQARHVETREHHIGQNPVILHLVEGEAREERN